jgi:hypothetical protein
LGWLTGDCQKSRLYGNGHFDTIAFWPAAVPDIAANSESQ